MIKAHRHHVSPTPSSPPSSTGAHRVLRMLAANHLDRNGPQVSGHILHRRCAFVTCDGKRRRAVPRRQQYIESLSQRRSVFATRQPTRGAVGGPRAWLPGRECRLCPGGGGRRAGLDWAETRADACIRAQASGPRDRHDRRRASPGSTDLVSSLHEALAERTASGIRSWSRARPEEVGLGFVDVTTQTHSKRHSMTFVGLDKPVSAMTTSS